ncbi:Aste57867_14188 [Aphanomyces stellatus]|uniref:Aste57867_14188 protein n=1 Tax=Aphanomyces stellatus TaxID=120398 RepID=A0A485L1P5_9STRA|nr:hypothetical protein As57867_014137 [Aphanomyces stellatus]VFT91013.1 Aste57867_14188 [Aphanomyces stellatus]
MNSSLEEALVSLREIVGPSKPDDELRALLRKVNGDIEAAAEHYFADESKDSPQAPPAKVDAVAASPTTPPPPPNALEKTSLTSLKELLGDDVLESDMRALLTRAHDDVSAAVDMYFADKAKALIEAFEQPPVAIAAPHSTTATPENGRLHLNEEYEVDITDGHMKWTIGNVLGRVVVQDVIVGGAAYHANIQKADVLIGCAGNIIKDGNVGPIVTRLSKEEISVPIRLRFRRADHTHSTATVTPVDTSIEPATPAERCGIHIFESALEAMRQTASDVEKYPSDLLLQYYLWSQGNVPLAMDQLFQPTALLPNFDGVVGHDWYSNDGTIKHGNPDWPLYDASFPAGPMGITVENIHERTIVVNVKDGTSASRANVSVDSWLVAINGECITHLTHREALHMIHNLARPLLLSFCVTPGPWLPALKDNMKTNIRLIQSANPNERHEHYISDDDRTSFKRFVRKLSWAIKSMPSCACVVLHGSIQDPAFDATGFTYTAEEPAPRCTARAAIQAMLQGLDTQADKGERHVIDLARGLIKVALWCIGLRQNGANSDVKTHSWWILHLVLDVFENGSVMEKNSTWDAIADGLKAIGTALPRDEFVRSFPPLIARLSLYSSPSSRIIPLAILPLAYPLVQGDIQVQFRGLFERLTMDDAPLVRRAAVYSLPALAEAMDASSMTWVLHSLEKLCGDHSDLVRLYAVQAIGALGSVVAPLDETAARLVRCQLLPLVNSFVSDADWQVRHETVQSIPRLLGVFGKDFSDVLVDHFVELAGDANMEVRIAAAKAAFPISAALSPSSTETVDPADTIVPLHPKVPLSILPSVFSLSKDPCASVRRAVAGSLGPAIALLGINQADVLEPMIQQLVNDKDSLVCQIVVEQLAGESASLPDDLEALLLSHIERLAKARPWRSRLLAIECIQKWSRAAVPPSLVVTVLTMTQDTVCQVRLGSMHALVRLSQVNGTDWFVSTGLAPVLGLLDQSFQLQLTGLEGLRLLADANAMPRAQLDLVVDRLVVAATQSKTTNIRAKALTILVAVAETDQVEKAKWELLRPTLDESFEREEDMEVMGQQEKLLQLVRR